MADLPGSVDRIIVQKLVSFFFLVENKMYFSARVHQLVRYPVVGFIIELLLVDHVAPLHFARVVRADQKRAGLLYAGTEYGMYISFDDGANWKSFQLNLPEVPITDLTIKENDLVVATQGRAFLGT